MRSFTRKRETFIALRARRSAHRIASEIINPHVEEDRPAYVPKTPLDPEQFHTPMISRRSWCGLVQPENRFERFTLWIGVVGFSMYIVWMLAHLRR